MKSRKLIKNDNGIYNIVWFGSCGKDENNNKISAENYSEKQEGVRDDLIQRLTLIKGELWYRKSYGLPLLDKIKSKGIFDSIIIDIILSHPDVVRLLEYTSTLTDKTYSFDFKVQTIYSDKDFIEIIHKV